MKPRVVEVGLNLQLNEIILVAIMRDCHFNKDANCTQIQIQSRTRLELGF